MPPGGMPPGVQAIRMPGPLARDPGASITAAQARASTLTLVSQRGGGVASVECLPANRWEGCLFQQRHEWPGNQTVDVKHVASRPAARTGARGHRAPIAAMRMVMQ